MTVITPESTLIDRLTAYGENQATATAYTFLDENGEEASTLTYAELSARTDSIAAALRRRVGRGERALLLLPDGIDFMPTYLGCLRAGVIAVPAYPPLPMQAQQRMLTLRAISADSEPTVVVTSGPQELVDTIRDAVPELAGVWWVTADELVRTPPEQAPAERPAPDDIAFLQYTSGSTSEPKGVVVTHRALMHNEELIRVTFGHDEQNRTLAGWLPLFHDMGLIGNSLQPLWLGGHGISMSPLSFIKRPVRWLQAVTNYRANTSGAPNFAYEMCLRRISDEECAGLDLSAWKVAFSGAEPVRAATLDRFTERFAEYGFHSKSLFPVYGLAEATLLVTASAVGAEPVRLTVDPEELQLGRAVPLAGGWPLVSSGTAWKDRSVVVVDPETREQAADSTVGEIWIGGPDLPAGYWRKPEASAKTFEGRILGGDGRTYLRSGDLGFIRDDEVYITGRHKDLIIVGGRNHYPHDIECTVENAHPAARKGCSAAFSVDMSDEETVVVVAEIRANFELTDELIGDFSRISSLAISQHHGINVHEVVPVGPDSVPKTSSGKLQRHAARRAYLAGEYSIVHEGVHV